MSRVFEDLDEYLPANNSDYESFGTYISTGRELAEELGFETVYLFDEDVKPPKNTAVCEGENGYIIFEEDYPFERGTIKYVEKVEPTLPEALRFRNKHIRNVNKDDSIMHAESLDHSKALVEYELSCASDAVENVVLSAMKDFLANK